jgi:hypothetical protein
MTRELAPKASEEPHCPNRTQEVIVREMMPAPEKNKTLSLKHLTSDENMSKAMRRLFEALDFG